MARYIDADVLETAILHESWWDNQDEDVAYEAVRNAPTADVETVVHGKWIPFEELRFFTILDGLQCSICGSKHNPELATQYTYCPECGAHMGE